MMSEEEREMDIGSSKYFSDKLRNCAGSITEVRTGKEMREILTEGFILMADAVMEDEITVRRLIRSCYLKGAFIGSVITQVVIIIASIAGM